MPIYQSDTFSIWVWNACAVCNAVSKWKLLNCTYLYLQILVIMVYSWRLENLPSLVKFVQRGKSKWNQILCVCLASPALFNWERIIHCVIVSLPCRTCLKCISGEVNQQFMAKIQFYGDNTIYSIQFPPVIVDLYGSHWTVLVKINKQINSSGLETGCFIISVAI